MGDPYSQVLLYTRTALIIARYGGWRLREINCALKYPSSRIIHEIAKTRLKLPSYFAATPAVYNQLGSDHPLCTSEYILDNHTLQFLNKPL